MWQYGFGIPDELFIRGSVPMTKQEIRVLSLSKMRLKNDSIVWDIGAGTGSVSVEAAVYCKEGRVFAIEKNPEAVELLKENRKAFRVKNMEIVCGQAPEVLLNLPCPDSIFIGGSGDFTEEILETAAERIKPCGIIVANAIAIDTLCSLQGFFKVRCWERDITLANISTSKQVKGKTMMLAHNPIYIFTARKPEDSKKAEEPLYE